MRAAVLAAECGGCGLQPIASHAPHYLLLMAAHTTMSAMDQASLLAKLQALGIEHENHQHGAVMTCEAQVGLPVMCRPR